MGKKKEIKTDNKHASENKASSKNTHDFKLQVFSANI